VKTREEREGEDVVVLVAEECLLLRGGSGDGRPGPAKSVSEQMIKPEVPQAMRQEASRQTQISSLLTFLILTAKHRGPNTRRSRCDCGGSACIVVFRPATLLCPSALELPTLDLALNI